MFAMFDDRRRRNPSSARTRLIAAAATLVLVAGVGSLRLSGTQHVGSQRLDVSPLQWTRPVEEETRRRVLSVLSRLIGDGDDQVRESAQRGLEAIAALPAGTMVVASPCRGNCVMFNPVPVTPSAIIFEIETEHALLDLHSQDNAVRRDAVFRLLGRTENSAEALAQLLQDPDPTIRSAAAMRLDSVVFPAAAQGWIGLLGDPDASLRERAAISLGAIGDPSAIDPLEAALLNDASPDVRRQAVRSLGLIAAGG